MSEPEPDDKRLTWMYRQMLRIREFEERVKATFTEHPGVIRGHTHLADGAEASIVGSLAALRTSPGTRRPGDQVMTTYRCHGYPLVLGSDPKAVMAEIYGRATTTARKGCAGSRPSSTTSSRAWTPRSATGRRSATRSGRPGTPVPGAPPSAGRCPARPTSRCTWTPRPGR